MSMGLWTPQLVILPGAQVLVQLPVLVLPVSPFGKGVLIGHRQMYREGISMEKDGNRKT